MANELTGQTAIVTGAGRGFGKAIALGLAAAGAAVTATARSTAQIEDTAAQIEAAGGRALAIAGNVTRRQDVARVVERTLRHFGPVTVLVNNAGIPGPFGPLGVVDVDEWWAAQEVHLRAVLLFTSAVLPHMVDRRLGHIINVAAKAGVVVAPNMSAYCVGKAAQIRFTEHIAVENRQHGISAFAIEPGTVITDMARETIASPQAQRWVPQMVQRLTLLGETQDRAAGLARCAERCLELASGRYDGLSGRYLIPEDDLDELLRQATAK